MTTTKPNPDTTQVTSPLWALLAVTALNSFSTSAISYGVFFVTQEGYAFNEQRNLALGLLMGAMYVVGALCIGPLLRSHVLHRCGVSNRLALLALTLGASLLISIPGFVHTELAIWFAIMFYMPLMGAIWPIVESYISGGKQGIPLRRAISAFNVAWSTAVVLAMWLIAPLLKDEPLVVFLLVASVHALSIPFVLSLATEPGQHIEAHTTPHPQVYETLLPVFRWLLVSSYLLGAALSPLLPYRFKTLGIAVTWAAILASAWMASRIMMFGLLGVWSGWHGRWRTVYWTTALLLGGFSIALLAQDPLVLVLGLLLFGGGMGGIYTAALYYAMAVGASQVEAGGKHEAVIGMGFTLGPLAGIGGYWIASLESVPLEPNQAAMIVSVTMVLLAVGYAMKSATKTSSI